MKTTSIRMLTVLLLACAIAAGLVTDAGAKVTITQPGAGLGLPARSAPGPPGAITGGGAFITQVAPSNPSAAALIDATTLFTGSNLSVQNVTLGACSFTVDFD